MANPTNPTSKGPDTASKVADQAKETGSKVLDQAKDTASAVADRARSAASAVGDKAENLTERAGEGLERLAGTVRDRGPSEGYLGSASSAVASGLERGGRYLQEEGLSGMADDLTGLIRRNPIPALLVGIGLGFFLARLTRS